MSDSLWPHRQQHTRPPVPHHLPEFAQVHVHCIGDAVQPAHPLMPSYPSALNLSHNQGLLGAFFSTMVWRHQFFDILPSLWSSSYNHTWPLGRPQPWLIQTFVGRVMSLLFNTLSRFVITFPAKKQSSSDFMATVTIYSDFGVWEGETCHYFHLFPFVCCAATGADAVILVLPREKQMTHGRTISKSVAQVLVFVCVVSKNMICQ